MAHRLSPGRALPLGASLERVAQAEVRKAAPGHVQHLLPARDLREGETQVGGEREPAGFGVEESGVSRGDGMGYKPSENPRASGHSQ